ncbi:hypothetical protein SAY87_015010 [Trapa incisa]|uniref:Uncharacterized protein n=1 Tax=Trapa incisa TaxID=236973 RepID=A0AAN7H0I6_9MYRT|nr:hypothetical protein SAY87_015010 [Trapa incisa]
MEQLSEKLQELMDRARELRGRIDREIAGTLIYCRFCSDHSGLCDMAGDEAYEDREMLAEIRDLLKDLETMLVYLQRLRSWQVVNWESAVLRLEESRAHLVKKAQQYHGRPLDVIQELNECSGNEGVGLKLMVRQDKSKDNEPDRTRRAVCGFLARCIGDLLNPWKWHDAARIAIRVVLVSVTVWRTFSLVHGRQRSSGSMRRRLSLVGSNPEMNMGISLDVVYGRG